MPLCRLSIPAHLPSGQARALADAVHQGLVSTCKVPEKDRFQLITRFAAEAMILDPVFPDVRRTADACVVEILFLHGRTEDQKRALYRQVCETAVRAGFVADDIMITLAENASIDWSLGRGEAYKSHAQAQDGLA